MRHDKLDRELSLLLLLTENRRYTVDQLCARLSISRRNLYYYLEFFRDYGFVVDKQGTTYRIDKSSDFFKKLFKIVHFTEDEAITIRRILDCVPDHSLQVQHLRKKLDALYDLNILDDVTLQEQFAQNVSVLYEAIKYHRCVVLHHYSSPHSNTMTDRIVEPFLFMDSNNDIRCYEISSKTNKTFKLSRMESVELLADEWQFTSQHRQLYTDIFHFSDEHLLPVRLRIGRLSYNLLIEEQPKAAVYISQEDDLHWLLNLDVCSYKGIGRFVLGLYDDIDILGDEGFLLYIHQKITAMASRDGITQ